MSSTSFCSNPDALGLMSRRREFFIPLRILHGCLWIRRKRGIGWPIPLLARRGIWSSGRRARSLLLLALMSGLMRSTSFSVELLLMSFVLFQTSRPGISRRVLRQLQMLIRFCWSCRSRRWRSQSGSRLLSPRGLWAAILLSLQVSFCTRVLLLSCRVLLF